MRIVVLLVGLAVGISSRPARACECDSSRFASPSTNVPLRGTLYIRDELGFRRRTADISWSGTPGVVVSTALSSHTIRVDYIGAPGSTLRIATSHGYESYELRPDWQLPTSPPRIGNVTHAVHDSADFVTFDFDQPAVAIRVRWTRQGRPHEWIEIQRIAYLPEKVYVLAIGDLLCGGWWWIADELRQGGSLELFAIYADGTETHIETRTFFSSATLPRASYGAAPGVVANNALDTNVGFEPPVVDVRDPSTTKVWMQFASALLLVMSSLLRAAATRMDSLSR
jgi:hypothetical protein